MLILTIVRTEGGKDITVFDDIKEKKEERLD